jgi:NAD-dependent dihydropyrimidine dehydrogenase PreA subunit
MHWNTLMLMEGAMAERGGRVEIDSDQCKGCGMCVAACPTGSLRQSDSLNRFGYYPTEFLPDTGCTACSVCLYACPAPTAISVSLVDENAA